MVITWDEAKRLANIDKHGVDFAALITCSSACSVRRAETKGVVGPVHTSSVDCAADALMKAQLAASSIDASSSGLTG